MPRSNRGASGERQSEFSFGAAEGSYNERESTLYNALRSLPRNLRGPSGCSVDVARFKATGGAIQPEGISLTYEEIAACTPDGLWCSDDTAKRTADTCIESGLSAARERAIGAPGRKSVLDCRAQRDRNGRWNLPFRPAFFRVASCVFRPASCDFRPASCGPERRGASCGSDAETPCPTTRNACPVQPRRFRSP